MDIVNIRKKNLVKMGYKDFNDWNKKKDHLYIGRNMSFYVPGTEESKWKNPFSAKKYGRNKCIELYEDYIKNSKLYNQIEELNGKVLGCWCKPEACHGDVLIELLKEKLKSNK